jgi:hypothetical protein
MNIQYVYDNMELAPPNGSSWEEVRAETDKYWPLFLEKYWPDISEHGPSSEYAQKLADDIPSWIYGYFLQLAQAILDENHPWHEAIKKPPKAHES